MPYSAGKAEFERGPTDVDYALEDHAQPWLRRGLAFYHFDNGGEWFGGHIGEFEGCKAMAYRGDTNGVTVVVLVNQNEVILDPHP